MRCQLAHKAAFAGPHIQHTAVFVKEVGRQNLLHHKALRCRHELRIARELVDFRRRHDGGCFFVRIRPILGHAATPGVLQELQGVLHVLVEQMVVLNHLRNALVLRQGHAQGAQAKATLAAVLQQAQRHRRQQQTLQDRRGQASASGQCVQVRGRLVQGAKQVQAHTAQHHLAVHKTGHQIKQLARAATRQPSRQWIAQRPSIKPGVGIPALKLGLPCVLQRG